MLFFKFISLRIVLPSSSNGGQCVYEFVENEVEVLEDAHLMYSTAPGVPKVPDSLGEKKITQYNQK